MQLTTSDDSRQIIYTKVVNTGDIEVFRMTEGESPKRLTESGEIKTDPLIDNAGHAIWLTNDSIYVDATAVPTPEGTPTVPHILGDTLFLQWIPAGSNDPYLASVDMGTLKFSQERSPVIISRLSSDPDNANLWVEGFNPETGLMAQFAYIPSNTGDGDWVHLTDERVTLNGQAVDLASLGASAATSLIAKSWINVNDPLGSLAEANNNEGRLSWYVSYRLLGLLAASQDAQMASALGSDNLNATITRMCGQLVQSAGEHGWPTTRYSTDQSELWLLVTNATVLYPLLKALNMGFITDPNLKERLLATMRQVFVDNETNWVDGQGYHFQYGSHYEFDGVIMPWNQQTIFGLALIEMTQATGDERYVGRAVELVELFSAEFVFADDGSLLWRYWPQVFYDGWESSDTISVNTPSRKPTQSLYFEDVPHASWNSLFLQEVAKHRKNQIRAQQELDALRLTVSNLGQNGSWACYMGAPESARANTAFCRPKFGWVALNVESLNSTYSKWFLTTSRFDGDPLFDLVVASTG
ncbi:MAG: hypothetical protein FWD55_07245 [Propionibacteriaceae bacterium]|nr:hypothetical protein [Propionibacteriaceae bacterium]